MVEPLIRRARCQSTTHDHVSTSAMINSRMPTGEVHCGVWTTKQPLWYSEKIVAASSGSKHKISKSREIAKAHAGCYARHTI